MGFFDVPGRLAPPRATLEQRADKSMILRSPEPLGPVDRCVGVWLERWAQQTPDAPYLTERAADGSWRRLSYRQVRQAVGAVAQACLDLNLPQGKPIVVLSDNAVDHALLVLAAQHIGRPVCTVSSAYSRMGDFDRLAAIVATLDPALLYASDGAVYGAALRAVAGGRPVVLSAGADAVPGALVFNQLLQVAETAAVMAAFEHVGPQTHAKYLLTSGSTGTPKVVINTHQMQCVNQQQITQLWPFLLQDTPVVLDWLPWSHTFGANHNFNMVLRHGGELIIDEGRPMPGLVEKTVANLREISPTLYFNVPKGFDALLPFLEKDAELAAKFFARLRLVFYAGAALPQPLWERLEAVAQKTRGEPVFFTSAWGSTETAPLVTSVHFPIPRAGNLGLPAPGIDLKFVPNADKFELRVRGPSIFPGYRNAPDLTAQAFDEEGYYKIGDAGYLVDAERPEAGVVFNGRIAEDFKLITGTWVSVGALRLRAIAALAPLAQDVVITGHDRDEVGLLVFAGPAAAAMSGEQIRDALQAGLQQLAADAHGSAQRPTRAMVLTEPPSAAAGEITDKGYLNQRAVLTRRAEQVQALYAATPSQAVVVLTKGR